MVLNLFEKINKEWLDSLIRETGGQSRQPADINFSAIEKKSYSANQIASIIDHTILKAAATGNEVKMLCQEALEYKFASVCVNPAFVELCARVLEGSTVKVCTVIGFPLGSNESIVKKYETEQAINNGADEVDVVINIGRLKDSDYNYVYRDISMVVESAKVQDKLVKVILENCYLTDEEKVRASLLSIKAGADFIKTSTGFGTSGASAFDVAIMKYAAGKKTKVKAAGGIRTKEDAEIMMSCGADRLGTSAGVKIIKEFQGN